VASGRAPPPAHGPGSEALHDLGRRIHLVERDRLRRLPEAEQPPQRRPPAVVLVGEAGELGVGGPGVVAEVLEDVAVVLAADAAVAVAVVARMEAHRPPRAGHDLGATLAHP